MAHATGSASASRLGRLAGLPGVGRLEGRRLWTEAAVLLSFIAAILSTSYVLAAVPNVKLFDLMVFVAGYTLGFRRGAAVAVGAWLVYGNFNPWGPAGPALLSVLMASEVVYALAGAGVRRLVSPQRLGAVPGVLSLLLGAVAVVSTLAYDVATSIFTGVTWAQMAGGSEYGRWIMLALFNPGAVFFFAVHIASNLLFFALLGPVLIAGVEKGKEALLWSR